MVNPSSGRGRALELLPAVSGKLRDAGLDLEILLSRDFAEARTMTQDAVASGADVLAVMGGDGMMHLGLNTCAHARLSGSDVMLANSLSWPKGSLRYPMATFAELRVFAPLRYRLLLDGVERELEAMLVAVGNTSSYGGGMRICPDADAEDGLLDITIVHPVSRWKLLQLLPLMYSGRFVRHPCVGQLRVREVSVEGPGLVGFGDGELIAAAPLTIAAVSRAVQVCVGIRG